MNTVRSVLKWAVVLLILTIGIAVGNPATAAPPTQGVCEGAPIAGGCFFTQTTGGNGGYSVIDDNAARFWAEYQRLGGAQTVGYPISRRFVYDGFITQSFQKLVLQWRPEVGIAYPMNIFDELSEAGLDDRLFAQRQTPYPLVNFDPPGATWGQIVARRQALMSDNTAIQARYFSFSDPLNVFGLPFSRVEDMGNHYAVRTQRAVFQQWKETVPWAQAGQVTIANGGDIAKEMGWYNPEWLVPENIPGDPVPTPIPGTWSTRAFMVGSESHLYVLQQRAGTQWRLLQSTDEGATWAPFSGGLPPSTRPTDPSYSMAISPVNADGLVAVVDWQTVYVWTGSVWERRGDCINCRSLVVSALNANTLWAGRYNGWQDCTVVRSDDGGRTWNATIPMACSNHEQSAFYGVDPRSDRPLYIGLGLASNGTTGRGVSGIMRYEDDADTQGDIIFQNGQGSTDYFLSMTVERQTGAIYTASGLGGREIWVSSNPATPNPDDVTWSKVYTFPGNDIVEIIGSGTIDGKVTLYATVGDTVDVRAYLHSTDGGVTWQTFNVPME